MVDVVETNVELKPFAPVNNKFFMDYTHTRQYLGGPVGTGKTITNMAKVFKMASFVQPDEHGVRDSRWLIARKNYGELLSTAMPDMEHVVAPGIYKPLPGTYPFYGLIEYKDEWGYTVSARIYWYAFDNDLTAYMKCKSLNLTGASTVESQQFESEKTLGWIWSRLGRYPASMTPDPDEPAPTVFWLPISEKKYEELDEAGQEVLIDRGQHLAIVRRKFMIGDFNFTHAQHWFKKYLVDGNRRPDGTMRREVYLQPPILKFVEDGNPADGIQCTYRGEDGTLVRNRPEADPYARFNKYSYWEEYYDEIAGNDNALQMDLLAEWGDNIDGHPVHPKFSRRKHVHEGNFEYHDNITVYVGVDNGLNNAWTFCQQDYDGKLRVMHEICNVGEDSKSIDEAIEEDVHPYITNFVPNTCKVVFVLDQAFSLREGSYANVTQAEVLNRKGYRFVFCPHKFLEPMKAALNHYLRTNSIIFSESVEYCIDGFAGGYHYKMRNTGVLNETPNKNDYSHPCETIHFVCSYLRSGPKKKKKMKRKKFKLI